MTGIGKKKKAKYILDQLYIHPSIKSGISQTEGRLDRSTPAGGGGAEVWARARDSRNTWSQHENNNDLGLRKRQTENTEIENEKL